MDLIKVIDAIKIHPTHRNMIFPGKGIGGYCLRKDGVWVTVHTSAEIRIHDPYVDHWYELEEQDTYPSPGGALKCFFRNQESLKQTVVEKTWSNP